MFASSPLGGNTRAFLLALDCRTHFGFSCGSETHPEPSPAENHQRSQRALVSPARRQGNRAQRANQFTCLKLNVTLRVLYLLWPLAILFVGQCCYGNLFADTPRKPNSLNIPPCRHRNLQLVITRAACKMQFRSTSSKAANFQYIHCALLLTAPGRYTHICL